MVASAAIGLDDRVIDAAAKAGEEAKDVSIIATSRTAELGLLIESPKHSPL